MPARTAGRSRRGRAGVPVADGHPATSESAAAWVWSSQSSGGTAPHPLGWPPEASGNVGRMNLRHAAGAACAVTVLLALTACEETPREDDAGSAVVTPAVVAPADGEGAEEKKPETGPVDLVFGESFTRGGIEYTVDVGEVFIPREKDWQFYEESPHAFIMMTVRNTTDTDVPRRSYRPWCGLGGERAAPSVFGWLSGGEPIVHFAGGTQRWSHYACPLTSEDGTPGGLLRYGLTVGGIEYRYEGENPMG